MTHENAPESTETASQPESGPQPADAAQGPLVERLAEAIWGQRLPLPNRFTDDRVEAVRTVVAAEVEAAVSVVRADMARDMDLNWRRWQDAKARCVSLEADLRQANLWSWEFKDRAEAAESEVRALREKVAKVEAQEETIAQVLELHHYRGIGDGWRECSCQLPPMDPNEHRAHVAHEIAAALSDPTTRDAAAEAKADRVEAVLGSWAEGIAIDLARGASKSDVEPLERLIDHVRDALSGPITPDGEHDAATCDAWSCPLHGEANRDAAETRWFAEHPTTPDQKGGA